MSDEQTPEPTASIARLAEWLSEPYWLVEHLAVNNFKCGCKLNGTNEFVPCAEADLLSVIFSAEADVTKAEQRLQEHRTKLAKLRAM